MADSVLAHILKQRENPLCPVRFQAFWEHFARAVGDTVDSDNLLYDAKKFFIEKMTRQSQGIVEFQGRQWWA